MSNLMNEFIEGYNLIRNDFRSISPFRDISQKKINELKKSAYDENSTFLILGSLSFYMYTKMSDTDIIALTEKDYSMQMYLIQTTRKIGSRPYAKDILLVSKKAEIIDPGNFLDSLVEEDFEDKYPNSILTDFESRTFSGNQKGFLMELNGSFKKYVQRLKNEGIDTLSLEKRTNDFVSYFSRRLN